MEVSLPYLDRSEAGVRLAAYLQEYRSSPNTIVIALPRGGVPVAYEVARLLEIPLDITYPRKIGAPGNVEYAIGAVTEEGKGIFHQDVIDSLGVSDEYIKKTIEEERIKAGARLKLYRSGRPPLDVSGKRVLIVDDGIATGSTMEAAITSLKALGASEIVVCVPVGPPDSVRRIEARVDRVVCLATPLGFYAVGQFYQTFGQTSDEEVIELMEKTSG